MKTEQSIFQNSNFRSIYNAIYNTQGLTTGALELNLQCNLSCIFCSRDAHVFRESENLSTPEIFSFIKDKDVVTFLGGEPLLDPRLPYLLEYCKKEGKKTAIISNGLPFSNPEICKNVLENLDFLTLSITSFNSKTYNLLTGSNQFSFLQRAFENILKSPYEKNIYKSINIVLLNSNIERTPNIPQFIKKSGLHKVELYSLLYPVYLGRLMDFPHEYPDPSSSSFREALSTLCSFLKSENKIIRFENMSSCFLPDIEADFIDSEETYGKRASYLKKINNELILYSRDNIIDTFKESYNCKYCLKKDRCRGLPEIAKILFGDRIAPFKEEGRCLI